MDRRSPSDEQNVPGSQIPSAEPSPLALTDAAGGCLLLLDRPGRWNVGRAADCDVVVAEPTVSRHHCVLMFEDGNLRVTDLGSTCGTRINGTYITEPASVRPGDVLTLGRAELTIRANSGSAAPESSEAEFDIPPPPPASVPAPGSASGIPGTGKRSDGYRHRAPSVDSHPAGERVIVRGIARGANVRSALSDLGPGYPSQVLTLSVHTYDAHGDPGAVVSVEMVGLSLHGPPPTDGEEVEVRGRFTKAGVLEAEEIRLVRSSASVRPGGRRLMKFSKRATIVVPIVFAIIVAIVVGVALYETGNAPWSPMITVPQVQSGEDLGTVESRLHDVGFRTSWLYDTSTGVPYGRVIRIQPRSGELLRKNHIVKIYINSNMKAP